LELGMSEFDVQPDVREMFDLDALAALAIK
jgi:hypothetical protein